MRRNMDEAGVSLIEVMIASALLLVALVTLLSALSSVTESSVRTADRSASLDQLRLMAANFGKDVRQANRVSAATSSTITLETLVGGVPSSVRWTATDEQLTRTVGSASQVFVIDLTAAEIFSYQGETTPSKIRRVRMSLATQPDPRRPPVALETETEMRNV